MEEEKDSPPHQDPTMPREGVDCLVGNGNEKDICDNKDAPVDHQVIGPFAPLLRVFGL